MIFLTTLDKTSLRTKPKCILISKHGMIKKTETAALVGWFGSSVLSNTISKFPNDMLSLLDLLPRKSTLKKYVKIGKKDY